MRWTIESDNDTGPGDEGFWEWWNVSDGTKSFRADTEAEAKWLCDQLNAQETTDYDDGINYALQITAHWPLVDVLLPLCSEAENNAAKVGQYEARERISELLEIALRERRGFKAADLQLRKEEGDE